MVVLGIYSPLVNFIIYKNMNLKKYSAFILMLFCTTFLMAQTEKRFSLSFSKFCVPFQYHRAKITPSALRPKRAHDRIFRRCEKQQQDTVTRAHVFVDIDQISCYFFVNCIWKHLYYTHIKSNCKMLY